MKVDNKEINITLAYLARLLPKYGYKLVHVKSATWANVITKNMQTIKDLWVLGWASASSPIILTEFVINGERYSITDKFWHANFSSSYEEKYANVTTSGKVIPKNCDIYFKGQLFCNPLTANHVYEGNTKDIAQLLKVTMMSQNLDDAYMGVHSVDNSRTDEVVTCSKFNIRLGLDSSPIELLLGMSSRAIRSKVPLEINDLLRSVNSISENEVFAKCLNESGYKIYSKEYYERYRFLFSDYYPIFTYDDIKNMDIEVPKDFFDIGVYGLGSAGTAILDQVCRSNWFETIYLCDFDRVETKNLRNQWYANCDMGSYKVDASERIISSLERDMSEGISTAFTVRKDYRKFQETELGNKKFKYVVSGFDSIDTRLQFLDNILDGKIEAKYLIDCRYLDLGCSIYIIDIDNTEELEFYKENLKADGELIKERISKNSLSKEEFVQWFDLHGLFECGCTSFRQKTLRDDEPCSICGCRSEACVNFLYEKYLKSLPNEAIDRNSGSCLKYNFIDIYKYVGAIVFGAIRNIENGERKPFTAIEAQTDVKGLPNYMVVKE